MPPKPQRECFKPGCHNLTTGTYCEEHKIKKFYKERESSSKRGYGYMWMIKREKYLETHPFCLECDKEGIREVATVVDHIIPHRGNQQLFWDQNNWQPLCKYHHDKKTARGL